MPSLPPEAQRDPSGDTVTVLMYPVCPTRLLASFRVDRFQTLINLSHPAEMMIGCLLVGEKRTQETHSVWPSGSETVYLHSPMVFQSLMVLSREPDTICLLSTEKATDSTSLLCPRKRRVVAPVLTSQRRRVPSHSSGSGQADVTVGFPSRNAA